MFVIYLSTEFQKHTSSGSLVVSIKTKAAAMLFYIFQNSTLTESFEHLYHTIGQGARPLSGPEPQGTSFYLQSVQMLPFQFHICRFFKTYVRVTLMSRPVIVLCACLIIDLFVAEL
jgi:hypothetical protein